MNCCSAGIAQKLWKNTVATKVKTANTKAAQRVRQPTSKAKGASTSTKMATTAPTLAKGKPTEAI